MRHTLVVGFLVLLAACGGSSTAPQDGALKLGIISGNHQLATAGVPKLTDGVVGKLVRLPNGQVAFIRIPKRAGNFLLDLLVPQAYAQSGTTVTGSPIAGAVVCAKPLTDGSMTPFVPCTNTGADGTAVFFFEPGNKAGVVSAEIRGTLNAAPTVFDTAVATVAAGAAAHVAGGVQCGMGQPGCNLVSGGDLFDIHTVFTTASDTYGNMVDLTGKVPSYAIRAASCGAQCHIAGAVNTTPAPTTPDAAGWTFTINPALGGAPYVAYEGAQPQYPEATLYVFLDGHAVAAWPLAVK